MKQEQPSANAKSEKVIQEQQEMKPRTTGGIRQQPPKVESSSEDVHDREN